MMKAGREAGFLCTSIRKISGITNFSRAGVVYFGLLFGVGTITIWRGNMMEM
jgi:hypothetical protein